MKTYWKTLRAIASTSEYHHHQHQQQCKSLNMRTEVEWHTTRNTAHHLGNRYYSLLLLKPQS